MYTCAIALWLWIGELTGFGLAEGTIGLTTNCDTVILQLKHAFPLPARGTQL